MTSTRSALAALLALALTGNLAYAQGKDNAPDERDQPHDLILAVDVSLSMIAKSPGEGKDYPPNDREGLRWDGIQFTVDAGGEQDRIALVLYRAENVVVTHFIDPSGFVRLSAHYPAFGNRSGRELLSELVAQLQRLEEQWAAEVQVLEQKGERVAENQFRDYSLPLLRGRKGETFRIAHGTASLLTLRAIEKTLLPQISPPPARAWVFLFTDGEEVARGGEGNQYPRADYDYIARRKGLEGKRLDDWVKPWVQAFRDKNVPVLTFALGETCDHALLQSLALQSTPPGKQSHRGASYNPRTNVELLDNLRHIQWELREYWTRPIGPDRRDRGQEMFTTPEIAVWRDLGLLLYRLPEPADKRARARAPLDAHMQTPPRAGGHDLPSLTPRKGRAYWYYAFSPSDPTLAQLPAGARLRLLVNKETPVAGEYTTHCVAALRTRRTLFHYREPMDAGKKYTPRDAIPFAVEFTPYALPGRAGKIHVVPFEAEDFEVRVTLTPAHRDGAPPVKTFTLVRDEPNAADPLAPRRFARDLVLDDDPASRGNPGLSGLYFVDVEIVGIQPAGRRDTNPLKGAVRRLIRRTLEVGLYPGLKASPARVVLGNDGTGGLSAEVRVELDMRTDPKAPRNGAKAVETNVAVALERGPVLGKEEIKADQFRIAPSPLVLQGRTGTFRLTVPAQALTALRSGDYEGGTLHLKAPWQLTATTLEVIVRKRAYQLHATPTLIRLDLSARGKSKIAREVKVELKTALDVREKVWLSAIDAIATEAPPSLDFMQVEDERGQRPKEPAKVQFQIAGLGPEHAASAANSDNPKRAALRFSLAHEGKLAPGLYQRKLYLVGPGVATVPLTVNLAVNQVSVRDRAGKPLDELYLLGLAGTEVTATLNFRSALASRPVKHVTVRPNWGPLKNLSPGGWDHLPLHVQGIGGAQQVKVALSVPRCVQEGEYGTEVSFEVTSAEGDNEQLMQVSLPVYVEVRHTGVRFPQKQLDAKGALWLHFPEGSPAPEFVTRELTLLSDAEKAPVRWSVERIAAKPGPGKPLTPDDGRLEVLFNGGSVLSSATGGKQPLSKGGPRDPIRRDHPCPLTIKVSRKRLAPGLHRAALRFRSREDQPDAGEGLVNDLEVYVVVPGRGEVTTSRVDAGPLYLGGEARVQVEVASYDSEPGHGELRVLDAKGEPTGPPVQLTRPESSTAAPEIPGKTIHRYRVKVTAKRAGANVCEVHWPRFRPGDGPEKDSLTDRLSLEARGIIEAINRVVGVNEDVLIRATVDPARRPEAGSPVVLHVLDRADHERDPVRLELYDDGRPESGDERAGDGVYSVRYRFGGSGTYDIVSPEGEGPGPLRPEVIHVNYEFRYPDRLGTIEYGGGDWLGWLGIHEELSDPHAIQLANKRAERCRWKARLLFPKGGMEASQLTARNVDSIATSTEPDPRVHLETRLTGPGAKEAGPAWTLGGVLQQDQEVELGIESKLSQVATDEIAGNSASGAAPHPALGKTSAVLLELQLEWLDDQGQVVERREMRVPLAIATRHWTMNAKPWILGAAALVVLFVLARVLLRATRRGKRPVQPVTEVTAPAPATVSEQKREVPAPQSAPPRYAGGDGDVPEHMR